MLMMPAFLMTAEAAAYCRLSKSYLEKLRGKGTGPMYSKFGRSVRYRQGDLDAWGDARARVSTSEL